MKVLNVPLLLLFASSVSAAGVLQGKGNSNGNGSFDGQVVPIEAAEGVIADEYLVMHDEGVEPRALWLNGMLNIGQAEILHEYSLMNAVTVRTKRDDLDRALKNIEGITVYENLVVTAFAVDSPVYSWGIDRSDQTTGTNNEYKYERDGSKVDVYILDTGIFIEHEDFGGRASNGADFTGEGEYDGYGHGTHVAGTLH
jgi:subtilisin family serine protease